MANLKKHNSDQMETFELFLDKNKFPIAYETKKKELVKAGMTEAEAENFIDTTPFEMEVYYSTDCGLFAVESEAVTETTIYDPYQGTEMEEADED